jgi:cytochrome b561
VELRDTADGFGLASRALHWASAFVIVFAWTVGTTMDALP